MINKPRFQLTADEYAANAREWAAMGEQERRDRTALAVASYAGRSMRGTCLPTTRLACAPLRRA